MTNFGKNIVDIVFYLELNDEDKKEALWEEVHDLTGGV